MMMWHTAGTWWMWLPMVLVWMGLLALLVWALRAQTAAPGPDRSGPNARAALDQRLARGELDLAEYRSLRAELDRR